MSALNSHQIAIINLGSQFTLLIERSLREQGFRSAVLTAKQGEDWLKHNQPKGIIISGGDDSVNDSNPKLPPPGILNRGIPVMGICYGMQWLAKEYGGIVESRPEKKGYGPSNAHVDNSDPLFDGLETSQPVWESHGDTVTQLPPGARLIARSTGTAGIAGFSNIQFGYWGVQFHPEVIGTMNGPRILHNFASEICRCSRDWIPGDMVAEIRGNFSQLLGKRRAIMGFSGGVDSTTSAALLKPITDGNLEGIVIDADQLRRNELEEIHANAAHAGIQIKVIDAKERFARELAGVTDAEVKRAAFRKLYAEILEAEAERFGAEILIQGTLATDLIESGAKGGDLIKTHHNANLATRLEQLHPLSAFFKYEVRDLAKNLGLPSSVTQRMPAPGPGLLLRLVDIPLTPDAIEVVRWADGETTDILRRSGDLEKIDQLVVAHLGVRTTGVKGDKRAYKFPMVVRPITSSDFMTAKGYRLSDGVEDEIITTLTRHPEVGRVFFDYTPKPPGTVEYQ